MEPVDKKDRRRIYGRTIDALLKKKEADCADATNKSDDHCKKLTRQMFDCNVMLRVMFKRAGGGGG